MKDAILRGNSDGGFTLVEVILTLVVAAIMSVFFIHFMGAASSFSWKSVEIVTGDAETEGKMEEIIAYYTSKINDDPDTALTAVVSTYNGQSTNDILVTTQYIGFDAGGSEIDPPTSVTFVLKVTAKGPANELVTILTDSRDSGDPAARY
jgi:prepilin-type N-terminal cleavage/methylation domain-containing protein